MAKTDKTTFVRLPVDLIGKAIVARVYETGEPVSRQEIVRHALETYINAAKAKK